MNNDIETIVPAYPAVLALLQRARAWTWGAPVVVLITCFWLAWRIKWPEILFVAPFAAWAMHFVVRVAIDVVSLVADTLMPR